MKGLIGILLLVYGAAVTSAAPALRVARNGRNLEIRAVPEGKRGTLELRLESSRNERISKFTDRAPRDPRPRTAPAVDRETWYPVVDVELEPDMEGVALFDPAPATFFCINGMFYREKRPLEPRVAIARKHLEPWENSLFVETGAARLGAFYLRQRFGAAGEIRRTYRLLSDDWSGRVSLHSVDAAGGAREIGSAAVAAAAPGAERLSGGAGLSRKRVIESLAATVAYTLRSQNRDPQSPVRGGLHQFYDLDARTFRSCHWIWGWGPSVKMLLDAAGVPELAARFDAAGMRRAAGETGRACLRFVVHDKAHPAYGVPVSRWDRSIAYDFGHREALTISDANFFSGWAWIPLYEATRDKSYLEAAETLALSTDAVSRKFKLIPQNYWPDTKEWSDFTLDESGFGTEGLAELYRVTGARKFRDIGERYIEQHLAALQQENGMWGSRWVRSKDTAFPPHYGTRAAGWAMEGLLASHRMMPEGKYLALARRMAEHLLKAQRPEGYWTYTFTAPVAEAGIAAKGTALWALLFYRLHRATGEPRHLEAARKALGWLMVNQYAGPDPEAVGSVYEQTAGSAVGYRHWFRVSCTYGSAFFGLAALEELSLQSR